MDDGIVRQSRGCPRATTGLPCRGSIAGRRAGSRHGSRGRRRLRRPDNGPADRIAGRHRERKLHAPEALEVGDLHRGEHQAQGSRPHVRRVLGGNEHAVIARKDGQRRRARKPRWRDALRPDPGAPRRQYEKVSGTVAKAPARIKTTTAPLNRRRHESFDPMPPCSVTGMCEDCDGP